MPDETTATTVTETTANPADTAVVNAPTNAAHPTGVTPGGTNLRQLGRTIEIVKGDPEGQKILASELGLMTKADFDKQRLADAKDLAVEAFAIPADKQKFIVGDTPAEIRQSAKELAALLNPAATTATVETQSTTETTATGRVEMPNRTAESVKPPSNLAEATDAYKALVDKEIYSK
jgi:hypothetical protein